MFCKSEVTFVFELHSKAEIRTFRKGCEDGTLKAGGNWKTEKAKYCQQASAFKSKGWTIGSTSNYEHRGPSRLSPPEILLAIAAL